MLTTCSYRPSRSSLEVYVFWTCMTKRSKLASLQQVQRPCQRSLKNHMFRRPHLRRKRRLAIRLQHRMQVPGELHFTRRASKGRCREPRRNKRDSHIIACLAHTRELSDLALCTSSGRRFLIEYQRLDLLVPHNERSWCQRGLGPVMTHCYHIWARLSVVYTCSRNPLATCF